MRLSVGAGFNEDSADHNIMEIAIVADQRMYEDKTEYYRAMGIDRRGQAEAHKALCNLYTKILKINLTDDTFSIINMDVSEQTREKGYADCISAWLKSFGETGYVHPDDLAEYLKHTSLDYLKEYFAGDKSSLIVFYRRKFGDVYKRVMMEMIPADDYSADHQSLFLYVNNIEK